MQTPRFLVVFGLLCAAATLVAQPPSRGRGDFDPRDFLSRLDRNGNGLIDPDEQQGPAKFMLSRISQYDPSIREGEPISLSKLTETFEKARAARESGRSYDRRGDRREDRDREADERAIADQAVTVELLVPGFGDESIGIDQLPLLGFGAHADLLTIEVTAEDQKVAESRIRSFDKNKNGVLEKDEFTRDFAGNPMDFDRNRDGRLTVQELAVRYAVRREGTELANRQKDKQRDNEDNRRDRRRDGDTDPFNGRKSYRVDRSSSEPEGLPGFFTDRDTNGDGQVSMAEYTDKWTDALITEFFDSDFNRDGIITADEALRVVEGERPARPAAKMIARDSSNPDAAERTDPSAAAAGNTAAVEIDSRNRRYAERIVNRNDKNKDGALTASEWKDMLMSPAKSDFNRDGKVTIDEYALWLQNGKK